MPDLKSFDQLPTMADETSTIEPVETLPPTDAEEALMADLDKNWDASEENAQAEETDTSKADRERDEAGKFKAKQEKDAADKAEADKPEKEVKAEAPKPDAVPEEDDEDKQDKKVPKGMHPKAWEGIKARKAELKAAVKEREATIAKLNVELEQARKVVPFDEEKSKRLKELEDFEFIHNPEKSGKITREFQGKLDDLADKQIIPTLSKLVNMPATKAEAQKAFDALDEEGKKAFGNKPQYSLEELKKAGIGSVPYDVWKRDVIDNAALDGWQRKQFGGMIDEFFKTNQDKQRALEQAPKDKETWEKQQKEAVEASDAKYRTDLEAAAKNLGSSLGDWATEKPVPANASPAQKTEMEARNKAFREKYLPAFVTNLTVDTPEKHAKVAMGVGSPVAMHWEAEATRLKAEAEQARKDAKEAQDALSKIKGAGRITQAKTQVTPGKSAPWNKSINESMAEAGL